MLRGIELDFTLHAESLNEFGPVGSAENFELPQDEPVRITARATDDEIGPRIEEFELRVGTIVLH